MTCKVEILARTSNQVVIKTKMKARTKMDKRNLYLGTLRSDSTKKSYGKDLKDMLGYIGKDEADITLPDLLDWVNHMKEKGNSTATIARRIGTCKRYFEFLMDVELIEKNPAKKLKAPRIVNKVEPTLTSDEVKAIIDCTTNPRDRAIIATLASTGMRISELVNITLDDFDGDDVNIVGKGSKRRVVHLNDTAMGYINEYLKVRKDGVDNLFVSNRHTPMNPDNINKTLKMLAKKAGVEKNIHNHSLRHLWATSMLDHGVPIEQIQLCMGHSDISVTTRYAKIRNERAVVRNVMDIEVI